MQSLSTEEILNIVSEQKQGKENIPYYTLNYPIVNPALSYKFTLGQEVCVAPYNVQILAIQASKRKLGADRKYQTVHLRKDLSNKADFDAFSGDVGVRVVGLIWKTGQEEAITPFIGGFYKTLLTYMMPILREAMQEKGQYVEIGVTDHTVNLTKSKKNLSYLSSELFTQWAAKKVGVQLQSSIGRALSEYKDEIDRILRNF